MSRRKLNKKLPPKDDLNYFPDAPSTSEQLRRLADEQDGINEVIQQTTPPDEYVKVSQSIFQPPKEPLPVSQPLPDGFSTGEQLRNLAEDQAATDKTNQIMASWAYIDQDNKTGLEEVLGVEFKQPNLQDVIKSYGELQEQPREYVNNAREVVRKTREAKQKKKERDEDIERGNRQFNELKETINTIGVVPQIKSNVFEDTGDSYKTPVRRPTGGIPYTKSELWSVAKDRGYPGIYRNATKDDLLTYLQSNGGYTGTPTSSATTPTRTPVARPLPMPTSDESEEVPIPPVFTPTRITPQARTLSEARARLKEVKDQVKEKQLQSQTRTPILTTPDQDLQRHLQRIRQSTAPEEDFDSDSDDEKKVHGGRLRSTTTRKQAKSVNLHPFGNKMINIEDLNRSILAFYYKNGKQLEPKVQISPQLKACVLNLTHSQSFDPSFLNDGEYQYICNIIRRTKIVNDVGMPRTRAKTNEVNPEHQSTGQVSVSKATLMRDFKIVTGEIESGNNNPALKKQLKHLTDELTYENVFTKTDRSKIYKHYKLK